ncbi:hypothetical protein ACNOYE_27425 [Nannocystaceae bacterium ST9]
MTGFETVAEDEGYKLGRVGNLAIVLWKTTPTVAWARVVCGSFPSIADHNGLAILTVLTPETGPPDGGVRRVFDETMKAMNERIVGNAIVIEAGGVLGSLLRAVSRTLTIVGRSAFAIETFSTTADATEWLVELLATRGGPAPSVDEVLDGLVRMRR